MIVCLEEVHLKKNLYGLKKQTMKNTHFLFKHCQQHVGTFLPGVAPGGKPKRLDQEVTKSIPVKI